MKTRVTISAQPLRAVVKLKPENGIWTYDLCLPLGFALNRLEEKLSVARGINNNNRITLKNSWSDLYIDQKRDLDNYCKPVCILHLLTGFFNPRSSCQILWLLAQAYYIVYTSLLVKWRLRCAALLMSRKAFLMITKVVTSVLFCVFIGFHFSLCSFWTLCKML